MIFEKLLKIETIYKQIAEKLFESKICCKYMQWQYASNIRACTTDKRFNNNRAASKQQKYGLTTTSSATDCKAMKIRHIKRYLYEDYT